MDKKISLDTVLEILELEKKQIILKGENNNFKMLQEKLQKLEEQRQEVLKGNEKLIEEILQKYQLGENKGNG